MLILLLKNDLFKRHYLIRMIGNKEDFVMTIAAPRRSGKSYFIKTMLREGLMDPFDHVIIMCNSKTKSRLFPTLNDKTLIASLKNRLSA
jgi:predicted AAA+ superfamily ATPase